MFNQKAINTQVLIYSVAYVEKSYLYIQHTELDACKLLSGVFIDCPCLACLSASLD